MNLSDASSRALAVWLGVLLAACAGDVDHHAISELGASLAINDGAHGDASAILSASGGPDAGMVLDAGLGMAPDATTVSAPDAAEQLYPTSAIGANPGDFCSPVSGERKYWSQCEARRGLRCRPQPGQQDAPRTCACAPGATFDLIRCSHEDWGADAEHDEGVEKLGSSTALGANYGDQCVAGAFPNIPWALCDARRGLQCRKPNVRPGTRDVGRNCLCPDGQEFVAGVCTPR